MASTSRCSRARCTRSWARTAPGSRPWSRRSPAPWRWTPGSCGSTGQEVSFETPHAAQVAGISTVYQEIELLPNVSVAENIALGREPRRFGLIDWRVDAADRARRRCTSSGWTSIPRRSSAPIRWRCSSSSRSREPSPPTCKVLVLDEPTSSLDLNEVAELFRVIRELKKRGVAILFVSHFLDQVYEICDRVTVLRDGQLVGEYRTSDLLRVDLVQKMLGHEVSAYRGSPSGPAPEGDGPTFFSARGVTAGARNRRRRSRDRRGRGAWPGRSAGLGADPAGAGADRGGPPPGGHHPDRSSATRTCRTRAGR